MKPPSPMDELARQALHRIEQMEAPGYTFPDRFSGADWAGAILVITLTAAWLVLGAWL